MRMTGPRHSLISSIFFARNDKYATAGEEAELKSLAASQPWTLFCGWSHCERLEASDILKYEEKSDHATYSQPFAQTNRQMLLSWSKVSLRRSKCLFCSVWSRGTHCNDGTFALSPSCFASHAWIKS